MKRLVLATVLSIAVATVGAQTLLAGGAEKYEAAKAGFEKLKSLAGTWVTESPDGSPAMVTYAVVSNGSAVMETISHSINSNMVSMYTVEGDHVMMTHYCGLGNQPRMRATVPTGDVTELKFNFVDGSNMKKNDMHMHALHMKFIDSLHVDATWSLYDQGKLKEDHAFRMTKAPEQVHTMEK